MALIDVDYFNTNLNQLGLKSANSPKAENLEQLILDASEWVEDYCRRRIEQVELIEVARGTDHNRIILEEWPIAEIASIEYDDDSGASGTVDLDDIRPLSSGIVEWKKPYLKGPWRESRTYTFTYTAGYDPIPNVVKRATALKVTSLFSPQYQGPRDVRSVEFVANVDVMIAELLEKYRRDRIY